MTDNMIKGIKENNKITKVLQAAQITNESRHLKMTFTKMVSLYGQQIEQSYTVERHFATLVSSIAALLNGKISPLLISPKEITDTLNFVQNHLTSLGFHVLKQQPHYYYEYGQFTLARKNLSLFISLKFPPHYFIFDAYKVLSFPVPLNQTSTDATQIRDIKDYFIIASNRHFHTSFSRIAFDRCHGSNLLVCPLHPMLKMISEVTCEAALFLNDKQHIKSKCNFRFLPKEIQPNILQLPSSQILIYKTPTFTIRCQTNDRAMAGCNFCIMTIPCQCTIINNNMRFDQKINLCNNS